jgi:hypothetical protein
LKGEGVDKEFDGVEEVKEEEEEEEGANGEMAAKLDVHPIPNPIPPKGVEVKGLLLRAAISCREFVSGVDSNDDEDEAVGGVG